MPEPSPVADPVADAAQTEVGSYFVANYPPFSVWTPDAVESDASHALATPAPRETPLGLYLHIPFCRKRCHFCYFRVYTDKNAREVEQYLDLLGREWELYADRPALAGRPVQLHLLRRRHPVVPLDQAARDAGRARHGEPVVGHGGRDHVRVRARHDHASPSSRRSARSA